MFSDVMLDLETLSSRPTATILSIGACAFNIETGFVNDGGFHSRVEVMPGFHVSDGTFSWWMGQSEAARKEIMQKPRRPLLTSLTFFTRWFESIGENPRIWANGACFDIPILQNAYDHFNLPVPWDFRQVRDCRTLAWLAPDGDRPFNGTAHNAFDDAKMQAYWMCDCWRKK